MKFASVLSGVAASALFAVPIAASAVETSRGAARAGDPFLWSLQGGKVLRLPQMHVGRYRCRDRDRTRFTIVDSRHYRDSSAAPGTYFYDLFFGTIVFHGAGLDGRRLPSDACARL
ncbi:MAG TPA: hypothetical protein VGM96_04125 [Reyranella sp.]